MIKVRKILLVILCAALISLEGCAVAAVGVGIAAYQWGTAKNFEVQTKCKESYTRYIKSMHEIKQKPVTIQEYCDREV